MRRLISGLLSMGLAITGWAAVGEGEEPQADLTVSATGAAAKGEPMTMACALRFVSVPSNTFVGQCQITVGADQVTVGGLPADAQKLLTVVLNGALTVRGVAEAGTGRFASLLQNAASGFPLDLQIDPLARAWVIQGQVPGGGTQIVTSGSLGKGTVVLAMP